ncbi:MAG: stage III sporulation protein AF [Bacillota bacterium]
MEKISLLIRDLILIVVFTAFLEILVPVGDMRRYVRMVMGVLVVVAVLQVFVGFLYRARSLPVPELTIKPPIEAGDANYEELRADYTGRMNAAYRQGVSRQVGALLRLAGMEVDRVEVVLDENTGEYPQIKEIRLHLERAVLAADGNSSPEAENAAKSVADFYNLPRERVVIATP